MVLNLIWEYVVARCELLQYPFLDLFGGKPVPTDDGGLQELFWRKFGRFEIL